MDQNQFAERIQTMRGSLYRTAYLYLGGVAQALDAVDEAVYKALISLKKLRQPEFFGTWITRILINECKSELRRRKRTIPLEEIPETAAKDFDSLPLKEAVSRLPRELKEPFILRCFSGFTTEETAKTLGIPQGTAATRIARAKTLLRLELSEEEVLK